MNTIINILTGIFFWAFILGGSLFGILGYQLGTYNSYDQSVYNATTFNTPEYKYSYHNNVFYIIHKFIAPNKFKDVKYLELKELKDEYQNSINSL